MRNTFSELTDQPDFKKFRADRYMNKLVPYFEAAFESPGLLQATFSNDEDLVQTKEFNIAAVLVVPDPNKNNEENLEALQKARKKIDDVVGHHQVTFTKFGSVVHGTRTKAPEGLPKIKPFKFSLK